MYYEKKKGGDLPMKRMHIHVSVPNIAKSIPFYSKMFASEPTVMKSDYAKWQVEDPKINFAISARGASLGVNHLGIQVGDETELAEMKGRLEQIDGELIEEVDAACCYASSDKYWMNDPAGIAWETFHTLDSIPVFNHESVANGACCVPTPLATVPISTIRKTSCS